MLIHLLKIEFVALISLLCLFYAGQNVTNLEACFDAFAYVLSNADHTVYPDSFFPAIEAPALIWLTLILVVTLEFAAGLLTAHPEYMPVLLSACSVTRIPSIRP